MTDPELYKFLCTLTKSKVKAAGQKAMPSIE